MINFLEIPTLDEIREAHNRIKPYVHRTPVLTSTKVNERAGGEVFFKCENLQKVGAFKFRGACNAVFSLPEESLENGVATHSSGNHAQAVALAARIKGIQAHIVMPENAPKVKIAAVRDYGADITFCEATLDARESTLKEVVDKTGALEIHPYNNKMIVEGQASVALELIDEQPDLDMIIAPVGGGGLISGTALGTKYTRTDIQVIGAEPEEADDAYRSFKAGKLIPLDHTTTVADGLRTSLGSLPFSIIKEHVDDIVTVSESSIIEAMRFIWERMKIIIEPSCAVPVAAVFDGKIDISDKKAGIIITGGNVDFDNLPWDK